MRELWPLHREAPGKAFEAASERAVCRHMKKITLAKVRDSLRKGKHVVTVPAGTAERSRLAFERMVSLG